MAVRPVALKKQSLIENDPGLFDTHPEVRLDFEHVRAALDRDEAITLVAVEPFHSSLCHLLTSLIQSGCTKNIRAAV